MYLISYAFRSWSHTEWRFRNDVATSPVQWIKDTKQHDDGEYVLIFAIQISVEDGKWCEENF